MLYLCNYNVLQKCGSKDGSLSLFFHFKIHVIVTIANNNGCFKKTRAYAGMGKCFLQVPPLNLCCSSNNKQLIRKQECGSAMELQKRQERRIPQTNKLPISTGINNKSKYYKLWCDNKQIFWIVIYSISI